MWPNPTSEDLDFEKLESTLYQVSFTKYSFRKYLKIFSIYSCLKFYPHCGPLNPLGS